mmetsp:Transcript_31349/g.35086  ORF Transcript_31349/g.35086 Transcript_31349/m.35086 type:complete len:100 (-) Transcript_31349:621-920(-)
MKNKSLWDMLCSEKWTQGNDMHPCAMKSKKSRTAGPHRTAPHHTGPSLSLSLPNNHNHNNNNQTFSFYSLVFFSRVASLSFFLFPSGPNTKQTNKRTNK